MFQTIIAIIEVLLVVVPSLLTVAFVTIAERKTMASMQRRLGPNIVGYYGLLQAFADALKLLLKEYVGPTQANLILFFLGPIITLIFSFLGSLRSTAQLISYELILSSAILILVLLSGNLNITINVEAQKVVFSVLPLLPIFIIFFIGCIAETNRAPFDLAEAKK